MTWATVWAIVFFVSVTGFAIMSVWVTIQGARDVVTLFRELKKRHEHD